MPIETLRIFSSRFLDTTWSGEERREESKYRSNWIRDGNTSHDHSSLFWVFYSFRPLKRQAMGSVSSSLVFTQEEIRGENVLNDATPLFSQGMKGRNDHFLRSITSRVWFVLPGERQTVLLFQTLNRKRDDKETLHCIHWLYSQSHVWVCESNPIFLRHWLSHQLLRRRDVISFSGTDREFSDERYWCQFCQFCQFFPCSSCWERRWFFLFSILVFSINSLCVSSLSSRRFYSYERRLNADTFTFRRKEESQSPRITLVWRQTWRGSLNKKENNKNNNSTKSL